MLNSSNYTLDDVIFSKQWNLQLNQNKSCNYRPKESHTTVLPKPKHPLKIHVWAAISKRSASTIRLFEGVMDSEFYTKVILKETLVPFIEKRFGPNHWFQQGNDPKHTSRCTKEFMQDHGINWWNVWPAGKFILFINLIGLI